MKEDDRVSELLEAIRPLVLIADEYDNDGLDEARPSWVKSGVQKYSPNQELYSGRGGKCLITLEQALHARDIATLKKHPRPGVDDEIAAVIRMYNASIPKLSWEEMSEDRRQEIIANYRKLGLP